MLDDAKKLADLKVENDEVVAMCYATAGEWPTDSTHTSFGMPAPPMLLLHLDKCGPDVGVVLSIYSASPLSLAP